MYVLNRTKSIIIDNQCIISFCIEECNTRVLYTSTSIKCLKLLSWPENYKEFILHRNTFSKTVLK